LVIAARRVPEKQVQAAVVRLYRTFGCVVHSLSQPRATMQTEGLPDLYVQCPKRRAAFFHEVKAEGGKLRPEQSAFMARELECGREYVVGGVIGAKGQLIRLGLLARIE